MRKRVTKPSSLYTALLLIFLFVILLNLVQVRAEKLPLNHIDKANQVREKSEVSPGIEDKILTPKFSSPSPARDLFSPPFTNQETTKPTGTPKDPIPKEIKPPDNIRLTGIVSNKLEKSAIIEISGKSYLVHEGSSIGAANNELKVVKITNKKVIIEKKRHFFTLISLSPGLFTAFPLKD